MARAVGIDLGTTNSVVAVLEGGEPTVVANAEGARTTPSVVAFAKNNEVLVGEVAKRQAVTNVERTARSVKRHMGEPSWRFPESGTVDGTRYRAQELSARVLQKLKRDAEAYLGEDVTDAVITVPAYFDDTQRQATKEAGEIAGLKVLRIINEPTAAALAYGLDRGEEQTVLVFDLGGGTFDVSLLEIGDGVIEVKATNGDTQLGGDDWDQRIVEHLVKRFKGAYGIDLGQDKMALQRLREGAEKAKIELSSATETTINLPYITASAEGPLHLDEKLTRAQFQELTADLLDRCKNPFHQAVKDAGREALRGRPRHPRRRLHPDARGDRAGEGTHRQGPAQGRQPGRGRGPRRGPPGGRHPRRREGCSAPRCHPAVPGHRDQGWHHDEAHRAQHDHSHEAFGDFHDGHGQSAVGRHPGVPGEREIAAYNKKLGVFDLTGLPPSPRGVPQIEVAFDIDANGIMHVSAKDLATGREQKMTVTGGSALPKDDIDRMMREAEQYADEDRGRRESAETRNQAEQLVYQTEKFLRDNDERVPADTKPEVESAITELKELLERGDATDTNTLRTGVEKLATVSQKMGQAMYAQAQQSPPQDQPGTEQTPPAGDEDGVVDAEIVDEDREPTEGKSTAPGNDTKGNPT
jgi:molecular chaperone DnaK